MVNGHIDCSFWVMSYNFCYSYGNVTIMNNGDIEYKCNSMDLPCTAVEIVKSQEIPFDETAKTNTYVLEDLPFTCPENNVITASKVAFIEIIQSSLCTYSNSYVRVC